MAIQDHIKRHSDFDETKDFVPTPPYATRVLFEVVHPSLKTHTNDTIWEPACGAGHMCEVFKEYGYSNIWATDAYDWGYSEAKILDINQAHGRVENIITNPPYKHIQQFISFGLKSATKCLALLTRIQVLEGQKRFLNVYQKNPPTKVMVFSDRIPFKVGEVVRETSKMFTHCWLVWDMQNPSKTTELGWVPPDVQARFERKNDYV